MGQECGPGVEEFLSLQGPQVLSLRLVRQEPGVPDACPSPALLKAGGMLTAGEEVSEK